MGIKVQQTTQPSPSISQENYHLFSFPSKDGTQLFGISVKTIKQLNGYDIDCYIYLVFTLPIASYFPNYFIQLLNQNHSTQFISTIKFIYQQLVNQQFPIYLNTNENLSVSASKIITELNIEEPLPEYKNILIGGNNISKITQFLFEEKKVIITGSNSNIITSTVEQLILRCGNFGLGCIFYYLLPQKFIQFLQVPFQFLVGTTKQILNNSTIQPETEVFDCDTLQFLTYQQLQELHVDIRFVIPRQMLSCTGKYFNLIYQEEKPDIILLNTNNFTKTDNFVPENIDVYVEKTVKKFFKTQKSQEKLIIERYDQGTTNQQHLQYKQINYMHLLLPSYYNSSYIVNMIQQNEKVYYELTAGFLSLDSSSQSFKKNTKLNSPDSIILSPLTNQSSNQLSTDNLSNPPSPLHISPIKNLPQIPIPQNIHNLHNSLHSSSQRNQASQETNTCMTPLQYINKIYLGQYLQNDGINYIFDTLSMVADQCDGEEILPHPFCIILNYINYLKLQGSQTEKVYNQILLKLQKLNLLERSFLICGCNIKSLNTDQLQFLQQISSYNENSQNLCYKTGMQMSLFQVFQHYKSCLYTKPRQIKKSQINLQKQVYEIRMNQILQKQNSIKNFKEEQKTLQKQQQLTTEQLDAIKFQQFKKPYKEIFDYRTFIGLTPPGLQSFVKKFTKSIWFENFIENRLVTQIRDQQIHFSSLSKHLNQSLNKSHLTQSPVASVTPLSLTQFTKQLQVKEFSNDVSSSTNTSTVCYNENSQYSEVEQNGEFGYEQIEGQGCQVQDAVEIFLQLFNVYNPFKQSLMKENEESITYEFQAYKQNEKLQWHQRNFRAIRTYGVIDLQWFNEDFSIQRGQIILSNEANNVFIPQQEKQMETEYPVTVQGKSNNKCKQLTICFKNVVEQYKFLQIVMNDNNNCSGRLLNCGYTKKLINRRKCRLSAIGTIQIGLETIQDKDMFLQWIYLQENMQ